MKKLFLCFLSALFLLSALNSCGTKPATAQTTEQITAEITKITPLPLSELTVILHAGGGWGGQTHLNAQKPSNITIIKDIVILNMTLNSLPMAELSPHTIGSIWSFTARK